MKKLNVSLTIMVTMMVLTILLTLFMFPKAALAQVKTIEVNKVSVSLTSSNQQGQGNFSVTLECNLVLDGTPDYTFTVSEDYAIGASLTALYQRFEDSMQAIADQYVAEQAVYDAAQLDTIVSTLESNLSW